MLAKLLLFLTALTATLSAAIITISPNPIQVTTTCCYGIGTIIWNAPEANTIKILVGSPTNGSLFAYAGNSGQATTGEWVTNGMTFYLVNADTGVALGSVTATVQTPSIYANPNPINLYDNTGLGQTTIYWTAPGLSTSEVRVGSPSGSLFAQTGSSGQQTTGKWVSNGMTFYLVNPQGGYVLGSVSVGVQNASGSPACNPSANDCVNPIPCMDCSGQWTDNYQDIFHIHEDSQGLLTGSSATFQQGVVQNGQCPAVTYELTGQFVRMYGNTNTGAKTDFTFSAINPDHSSTSSCQVSTNTTFTGSISSATGGGGTNCGYATGTWSNSLGYSGSFTWTKACDLPTGSPAERSTFVGWGDQFSSDSGYAAFTATLTDGTNWDGRDVREASAGNVQDTCNVVGAPTPAVTGGLWHVGMWGAYGTSTSILSNNTYGIDFVGDRSDYVNLIKSQHISCTRSVAQTMQMFCSTPTLWSPTMPYTYQTNQLTRWYRVTGGSVTYQVGRGDNSCAGSSCSPAK
jgi:hypothetical protein